MQVKRSNSRGSLLIEVLISIGLFLAISTIIAQAIFASFYGSRESTGRAAMNNIIGNQITYIRSLSDDSWSNIGSLERDVPYYVEKNESGLIISTGTYSGFIEGQKYTLNFSVKDALRDLDSSTTRLQLLSSSSTKKDTATLLITSTGKIERQDPVIVETYITRWRNIICAQESWTSTTSDGAVLCEASSVPVPVKRGVALGDQIKLCSGCI